MRQPFYIIDFEASSLSRASYPIEVAWGCSRNAVTSYLLNPGKMTGWTDWNPKSVEFHHISRDQLINSGEDPHRIASRMVRDLAGEDVYSDEPRFDTFWKDRLLADTGHDPSLISIKNLKYYLNKIIKIQCPGKRYMDIFQEYSTAQSVCHRAGKDVAWLLDFVEFIKNRKMRQRPIS